MKWLIHFLLDDNKKHSSSRLLMLATWVVASFSVIYCTLRGGLSEWLFTSYLATFAANYIAHKKFTKKGNTDVADKP